jgi:radical SAM superfamily enzyme YgiQ (UPF0313 family)
VIQSSDIIGGDEFVLVLPEQKDVQTALKVARKIINTFRNAVVIEGHTLIITSSIGISLYPDHGRCTALCCVRTKKCLRSVKGWFLISGKAPRPEKTSWPFIWERKDRALSRSNAMRLYLINPCNPLVSIVNVKASLWNRYRVWKPLSLLVLAGLTPSQWEITIIDENLGVVDYHAMPRPDLVGITAFTSQANRAYEIARSFRRWGVPVVMGGIHASMCLDEAMEHVDAVVTGEAESIWPQVLDDARHHRLKCRYDGGLAAIKDVPFARHDLAASGYAFGAIQTTRGCPLNCNFCSVTAFNGAHYRQRPIADVVREFRSVREKHVLVVDDNLIGTRPDHIERAKELFRTMAAANLRKKWVAQASINFADDAELLDLAAGAGCRGVFIGFETPSPEGLRELGKKFNLMKSRDFRSSVRRIQRHHMLVVGSFIIGLDIDEPGIGERIAETAHRYGMDILNCLFLTPLPGTRLWDRMKAEGRIALDRFPQDWKYYTLTFPVGRYKHLSTDDMIEEMNTCEEKFYSMPRIMRRVWLNLRKHREPLVSLVGNLSYRRNYQLYPALYERFRSSLKAAGAPPNKDPKEHRHTSD